ncbi:NUDIX hydrolase [Litchfieldia salsa]|uniref:ADP-ribose pyrophosphatase YjhB, NUDIX family n=1 Tax=Litchfieldia salsa TaxID=930152 RepID=A0A1H0TEE3_9BACI|nr:NUDIX domain-containing protein [Litchfieldia salsa]SDP52389.1 ADP-ribose pyrophosphatase YjhB, NUDIX family [Litchfieldia salsa]
MGYIEDLRKLVGTRPLILTGVAVIVLDQHKRLLMVQSDGMWKIPGGFIEMGETAEEAGIREISEEAGMNINNLQLLGVFSGKNFFTKLPNEDEYYPVTIAYTTKNILGGSLKPDGIETQQVEFFDWESLPKALSTRDKEILQCYKGKDVN